MSIRIYLAGYDVFLQNKLQRRDQLVGLCRLYGATGVWPGDPIIPDDTPAGDIPKVIYHNCISLLESCDVVVANANPWRGTTIDPGTAFEIGYAVAKGIPVILYHSGSKVSDRQKGLDAHDVEQFGMIENLMITVPSEDWFKTEEDAIIAAVRKYYYNYNTPVNKKEPDVKTTEYTAVRKYYYNYNTPVNEKEPDVKTTEYNLVRKEEDGRMDVVEEEETLEIAKYVVAYYDSYQNIDSLDPSETYDTEEEAVEEVTKTLADEDYEYSYAVVMKAVNLLKTQRKVVIKKLDF